MENVASCLARVIPQDAEDRNYAPLANLFAPHANSLLKVAPDHVTRTTLTDEGYEAYIDVQYSFSRFLVLELEFDGALTAIEILQRSVYDQEEKPSEKTFARQLLLGVAYYQTFESYLGKAMEQFRDGIQYASSMTESYVARPCLYIAMVKSYQGDQAVEDAREMLINILCNGHHGYRFQNRAADYDLRMARSPGSQGSGNCGRWGLARHTAGLRHGWESDRLLWA